MDNDVGFFVAPFAIDGACDDVGFWSIGALSPTWLGLCRDLVRERGTSFDHPWAGALAGVRTKVTSGDGGALLSIAIDERPAVSAFVAMGVNDAAEAEGLRMFVESLRRVKVVQAAAATARPFERAFQIGERPLLIVVPWPGHTPQKADVARELVIHLTGALVPGKQ